MEKNTQINEYTKNNNEKPGDICDVESALFSLSEDEALRALLSDLYPETSFETAIQEKADQPESKPVQQEASDPQSNEDLAEVAELDGEQLESIVEQLMQEGQDEGESLEEIEPAAGNESNAQGPQEPETGDAAIARGGFGFQSEVNFEPLDPIKAVGPIGPTSLQYGANFRFPDPSSIFIADVEAGFDFVPSFLGSASASLDESDSGQPGFPLQVSGDVDVDFNGEGSFPILANGDVDISGAEGGQTLTSGGETVTISSTGGGYTGTLPDGTVIFNLTIDPDTGGFTFELLGPLDHADDSDFDDVISLNFGISVTDDDGNVITSDITININDDGPTILTRFTAVDEDSLADGPIVHDGQLLFSFGADGDGEINPTGNFVALYEMDGQQQELTSNGFPITVSVSGNGYVGMVGGVVVFTLTIDPLTGEYTYTQFYAIDHPNGSDPDDVIWLKFEVQITDADGDTDTAYIGIDVHDNDDQGPYPPYCPVDGDGFVNVKCVAELVQIDDGRPGGVPEKGSHTHGKAQEKINAEHVLFDAKVEDVQFFDMVHHAAQKTHFDVLTKVKTVSSPTAEITPANDVLHADNHMQSAIESFVEDHHAAKGAKPNLEKPAIVTDAQALEHISVHDVIDLNTLMAPEPVKVHKETAVLV